MRLTSQNNQVNVTINGNTIPFNMKIGEAGEAFFVFETDDDIPEDLITSPLLEATKTTSSTDKDVPTGRFGAKEHGNEIIDEESSTPEETQQEPEFLDLDAAPKEESSPPPPSPPKEKTSQGPMSEPNSSLPSPPPSPTMSGVTPSTLLSRTGTKMNPHSKVDEYLQAGRGTAHAPEVSYKHG